MPNLGEYELHELIGSGGMSSVYRAYHSKLRRNVAMKVLSPGLSHDDKHARRFYREAYTVAGLQHSHIVPIFDYGVVDETRFLVMPLLTGGTLIERILRKPPLGDMLVTLPDIALFLHQLAGALQYAHDNKVVHRDIKPSNIIFDMHGTPFLTDFGILSVLDPSTTDVSEATVLIGTYAYMAPELWYGKMVTPAVDQYALGLVIYSLITGHPPFGTESLGLAQIIHKHCHEMPIPIHFLRPEASPAVNDVVERAIAKEPTKRYKSVLGFAEAFEKAVLLDSAHEKGYTMLPLNSSSPTGNQIPPSALPEHNKTDDWFSMPTRAAVKVVPPRLTRTGLADNGVHSEKIFMSYRRTDSTDITSRIYDGLVARFSSELIFRDLNSIPLGTNFKRYLENVVGNCIVELIIIGPNWANAEDSSGQRRLDNPDDFVRVEVEAALKRDIPVIPVQVYGASMPRREELPSSLSELVYCNGISIRTDPDFHADMGRLIKALERLLYPNP